MPIVFLGAQRCHFGLSDSFGRHCIGQGDLEPIGASSLVLKRRGQWGDNLPDSRQDIRGGTGYIVDLVRAMMTGMIVRHIVWGAAVDSG